MELQIVLAGVSAASGTVVAVIHILDVAGSDNDKDDDDGENEESSETVEFLPVQEYSKRRMFR